MKQRKEGTGECCLAHLSLCTGNPRLSRNAGGFRDISLATPCHTDTLSCKGSWESEHFGFLGFIIKASKGERGWGHPTYHVCPEERPGMLLAILKLNFTVNSCTPTVWILLLTLLNLLSPISLPPSRLPRETPINSPVSCSSSFPASCEDPGSAGDHRCGYVCQPSGAPVAKQHSRRLRWLTVPEVPESKGWFLPEPPRANLVQASLPARGDCWRSSAFLGLALSLWWVSLIVENVQEREVPSLCPGTSHLLLTPGRPQEAKGQLRLCCLAIPPLGCPTAILDTNFHRTPGA